MGVAQVTVQANRRAFKNLCLSLKLEEVPVSREQQGSGLDWPRMSKEGAEVPIGMSRLRVPDDEYGIGLHPRAVEASD